MQQSIWIGFDPREAAAFAVARHSARSRTRLPIAINGVLLSDLKRSGAYTRPTTYKLAPGLGHLLYDVISDAPMSTEFAISRFFTPQLAGGGWALFMDADVLVRSSLTHLFEQADPSKAVMVVKHADLVVGHPRTKMDGQLQLAYPRKNWSSVMLFNCDHPANRALTPAVLNGVPGRDLHAFCWLDDDLIGELNPAWNHLVGQYPAHLPASIAHFTEGVPNMPGYESQPFADEWRACLSAWAQRKAWR